MCYLTESESLERRLDSLAAENERLNGKVALLERDIDVGVGNAELLQIEIDRLNADFRKHSEAAVELYSGIYALVESTCGIGLPVGCSPLRAVKMLADRAAELTRERDAITRLMVVESLARGDGWYVQEDLPPKVKGRYPTFEAAVAVVRKAAGLAAAPAGRMMVLTPEQYEMGYAVPSSFRIQGGTPIRREPYRLIRRLPDGNYLVEDPAASRAANECSKYDI
jgi:hypothetical protein